VGLGFFSCGSLLPAIMDHVFNRRTFFKNSRASLPPSDWRPLDAPEIESSQKPMLVQWKAVSTI
jgi:hypothetical protein